MSSAWATSLDSVQKQKVGEIQKLLARTDKTMTQRLAISLELDKRIGDASKASYGASIAKAVGRGLHIFVIGLEAKDLYSAYNSSS